MCRPDRGHETNGARSLRRGPAQFLERFLGQQSSARGRGGPIRKALPTMAAQLKFVKSLIWQGMAVGLFVWLYRTGQLRRITRIAMGTVIVDLLEPLRAILTACWAYRSASTHSLEPALTGVSTG